MAQFFFKLCPCFDVYNPDFNYTEFGTIKNAAGSKGFVLSGKQLIEKFANIL